MEIKVIIGKDEYFLSQYEFDNFIKKINNDYEIIIESVNIVDNIDNKFTLSGLKDL